MEDIKQIEALIEKYYNGETSVEEERKLQWFFQTQHVPERLKPEAEMFRYYYLRKNDESAGNLNEKLGDLIDKQSHKNVLFGSARSFYWISGVAASVLILVGLWLGFNTNIFNNRQAYQDTFNDPQLAYLETKRILYLVSDKLNEGTRNLQNLDKLDYGVNMLNPVFSFGPGIQHLNKLSKFNEATELISKKNN
ncbi:MAG: hypothetical protein ISS19_09995 [Bacteroidales bacterium]|nr:hypothetical protein [Bacteroidales bacterium]